MKRKFSKAIALMLVCMLVIQSAIPAFAMETSGDTPEPNTTITLPSNIYANVEYNVKAVTENGTLSSDPYAWGISTYNEDTQSFQDITTASNLQPGAKGYDDNNHLYQNATFSIPMDYVNAKVKISVSYAGGQSDASSEFMVKKPSTKITDVSEIDECPYSYYDNETETLYCDQSLVINEYETSYAVISAESNEPSDPLILVVPENVGAPANDGPGWKITMGKNAAESGTEMSLNPSSGYKLSKRINLVKGVPATDVSFVAEGGYFADGLEVAKAVLKTNKNAVTKDADSGELKFNGEAYIMDETKSSASGFVSQTGEAVKVKAISKNTKANDEFKYDIYDASGNKLKTLYSENREITLQLNDPGTYRVEVSAYSIGKGKLARHLNTTFTVLVKEANPIINFETTTDKLVYSNKEFTDQNGVTYKTSGNLNDYIKITPDDFFDSVTYSSDNTNLVVIDSNGEFSIPKVTNGGTTKLWVKSNITGLSKSIDIEVIPGTASMEIETPDYPRLPGGHTESLHLAVTPETSKEEVTWVSSNPDILAVDEKGNITANESYKGNAVAVSIQATSSSGVVAKTQIIVCEEVPTVESTISVDAVNDTNKIFKTGDYEYDLYHGSKVKITYEAIGENGSKSTDIMKMAVSGKEVNLSDYINVHEVGENYIIFSCKGQEPVELGFYALRAGQLLSEARDVKTVTIKPIVPTSKLTMSPNKDISIYADNTYSFSMKPTSSVSGLTTTDHISFIMDNEDIASITKDEDGKYIVKGLKPGTTNVACYAHYDLNDPEGTYSAMKTFKITVDDRISMDSATIKVDGIKDYVYSGKENKPTIKVYYGNTLLREGRDYTAEYKDTVNVGTASINITGMGIYKGSIVKTYNISHKSVSAYRISLEASSYTYSGKACTPAVTISGLTEGKDFVVSYKDNVNAGTATVTVTGIGNYSETNTRTFTIKTRALKADEIVLAYDNIIFSGAENKPKVTIAGLTEDKDFAVKYENNVKAGTSAAVVTGIGNYSGTVKKTFITGKRNIANAVISLNRSVFYYEGKTIVPEVKVEGLKKNTDYTVKISNNSKPGVGTVTIEGKGNYTGSVTKDFKIKLKKPVVKITTPAKSGKPKLTWNAVKNADMYRIYRATSKNGTYKRLYTTSKLQFTNTSAVAGKKYYYKVVAVYDENEFANSYYSSVKSITCDCSRPNVKSSFKNGKPKLSWAKVEGAKKYEVYRATSKKGTYKKVKTLSGRTFVDKAAKKNKTYYYKVKAISKNKNANSAFSLSTPKKAKK